MHFFTPLAIVFVTYLACVNSDACVQCDSATNSKCATQPDAFLAKECSNATSKCFTRVVDGNTIRGCALDLDNLTATNCNNEMECLICTFNEGCNRQVFPTHRLKCLQCSGNGNDTCSSNIYAQPEVCPIYKLGDKCYIRIDGQNNTNSFQRGCLSSAQSNKLCVDTSNCYTCDGTGCNFIESNSTVIPLARDSAVGYGASLLLVMLGALSSRFF